MRMRDLFYNTLCPLIGPTGCLHILLTQLTLVELNLGYLHCGPIPLMHINWKFTIYFKWKETATPWTAACQASLCPSPTPEVSSNSYPSSQWCHPIISSPVVCSPLALNLSQHQGLFQWASSLHQVAKVLEFQLQHQSFQRILRTDFL